MSSDGESGTDLVILVADKNMHSAATALVARHQSLSIREITFSAIVHPQQDSGCRLRAANLLKVYQRDHDRALVMFDHDGCGCEDWSRERLELDVERQLAASGWGDRAAAIVLAPELEAWVWSDSPEVDEALGWRARQPDLRSWLQSRGLLASGELKPGDPKRAVEEALRVVKKPRSSSLYEMLAAKVSLQRCTDPAFTKFRSTLQSWFPVQ